jgi:hypothetical protein
VNKLQTGELTTKELVNLFGTAKMKSKCNKGGYIGGREKELLLTKARKFCDIEDLGKGKYIINTIYGVDKDDAIIPLKKGLYNYLAPLILSKLLDEDDQFKVTLPFLGWARKFEMVNDNYSLLKYNQEQGSTALDINSDTIFEYFEKMDDCIKYYLQECLTMLSDQQGLDLIDFDSIKMVKKKFVIPVVNNEGGIDITCQYVDEMVSDDDRRFIYECESKAKDKAGITNNKEKFYGVKSYIYKRELKTLLSQRNILFMYSAYNIYCKNPNEVQETLEKFANSNTTKDEFVKVFNDKFIEYVDRKAQNRQKREIKKKEEGQIDEKYLRENRLVEQYLEDYRDLLGKTIMKDVPKLDIINENDINTILTEFSINIVKK